MGGRRVRVFHISDLHMRSADGPQGPRARREAPFRWRVLGQKWQDHLAELRRDGIPFDLVVFTGDLADWGHPTDYPRGVAFLQGTCEALGVPASRLFVVPGNHDVDRNAETAAWAWLRKQVGQQPRTVSEWMAGGEPRGFRGKARRDQVLERQHAFWSAVASQLGRPELEPRHSPHGRLGYRQTVTLPGLPQPIHVIGLDTAWLAGDDHDAGNLWLTEHQVALLTSREDGGPLPGLRLALMHHRLADLADEAVARGGLADRVDVVLHGHQHHTTADVLQGPDHQMLVLAAGCLYEGDEGHRHLNACQVIDLELDASARPSRADVRFRGWSSASQFWGDDALLYHCAPGGRLELRHDERGWRFEQAAAEPVRHAPALHQVFIGRDVELAQIATALPGRDGGRVAIVALQGMAGIGKTYLAHEFYARHRERFGGYQHLVLDPERPGTTAAWMTVLGERVGIDPARAEALAVAQAPRAQRVLVHVDNVDSAPAAELVASLAHSLAGIPLLVTGRYTELGTSAGSAWHRIELAPLPSELALDLLRAEVQGARVTTPETELRELVRQVAGLPLALHLAAGYLRRGTTVSRFLARLREQGLALEPRDPADHVLADRARGVLSTSFAISRELLIAQAGSRLARWEAALATLGWAPRVGFGRSLGAAITDLDEASGAFDDFMDAAVALSLVQGPRPEARDPATWAVHPLLGEFLRAGSERTEVDARVGAWIGARASAPADERARRWKELSSEVASIDAWLAVATEAVVGPLLPAAWRFATTHGPVGPWLSAAQRMRPQTTDLGVLWALSQLAFRAGELETSRDVADDMAWLAEDRGADRDRALALAQIADVLAERGERDEALRIRRDEVLPVFERLGDVRERAITLAKVADVLALRGELDEALRIRREQVLRVFAGLGDVQGEAITLGKIADVLAERGEWDEALRIRREQELPVYERLGDARARAITLEKIADVLVVRGELDEALRIYREDVLPVFERLGDVRERAITLGRIADMLFNRGEWDEALRIRREEELPVYERVGDVRLRAITLGWIASVLVARGAWDEALRIRREEELPVYERLGDVRSRAVTLGQIAAMLADRGELDGALRIHREEVLPVLEQLGDVHERAITLGKIADVLAMRGESGEALRIRRDEALPVYERLGDVRSRAITLGHIADLLADRGELDEALRILRDEALPVVERLRDVRQRALTLGRIANVLAMRGESGEALRIRRDEELTVYQRLGDVRGHAITLRKLADLVTVRGELDDAPHLRSEQLDDALRIHREHVLPVFERLGDARERAITQGKIADLLALRGEWDSALRIRREEVLPVFERSGDVRQRAIARGKIADVLALRGELEVALTTWRESLAVFQRLALPDLTEAAQRRIARLEAQRPPPAR